MQLDTTDLCAQCRRERFIEGLKQQQYHSLRNE